MRLSAIAVLGAVAVARPPVSGQEALPRPLRIIAFGAEPNIPETKASGLVARWVAQGHKVKFVAMTYGQPGHLDSEGPRRRAPE